jgi:hypothetical protein
LAALIEVLSPDHARRAIKNVSRVVKPNGAMFIGGSGTINDSRTLHPGLVGFNLVFINVYDEGQAYTEQEHREWLEGAGFGDFERLMLSKLLILHDEFQHDFGNLVMLLGQAY